MEDGRPRPSRNPVKRGLVQEPEPRLRSSFRYYKYGDVGRVRINDCDVMRMSLRNPPCVNGLIHPPLANERKERGTRQYTRRGIVRLRFTAPVVKSARITQPIDTGACGRGNARIGTRIERDVRVRAGMACITRNRQPGTKNLVQADMVNVAEILRECVYYSVDRLALPVEVQVFHRDPGTGRGAKRGRSELNHGGTGRETTSLRLKSGAGADVISHSDQCRISWQTPSRGNDDGSSGQQDG